MILVDTSVLIGYLRGHNSKAIEAFESALTYNVPFGITYQIYQELLQGTKDEKEYALLKEYLDTFTFYSLQHGRDSYAASARLYFDCRRKGKTIRSSIDCQIAQVAIENKLRLLHDDRDFDQIAEIAEELELFN